MGFRVAGGDGGEPGVQGEPVPGRLVELGCGLLVGPGVREGEPVPELPELGLLGLGDEVSELMIPSAMAYRTPRFQPSSRAWLTVPPSPWELRAISARASRSDFSSKAWVLAASAARSTIRSQPASNVRRQPGWSRAMTPALLPQYRQVPAAERRRGASFARGLGCEV